MNSDLIESSTQNLQSEVVELRHDLHRHPELGYQEFRTAQAVKDFVGELPDGSTLEEGIGGTGMVITLSPEKSGPCVALRADMDALPMEEKSGVEWASKTSGVMHACGHDGHTAILAGALKILKEHSTALKGPVKFFFQPAEEGLAGGKAMCDYGCLENPFVDAVFGLHNNLPGPRNKFGSIAYTPGASMAGTGLLDIRVKGQGGHAAFPHNCIDPIIIGSQIVNNLQSIVSRNLDPMSAGVVSITKFQAGSAYNVIAEEALISGTIRGLDMELLQFVKQRIIEISEQTALAMGGSAEVDCKINYPVLVNDEKAEAAFQKILKESSFPWPLKTVPPIMGGEDFAFYAEKRPAFFYFLPACPETEQSIPMCHDPKFDFNDDLIVPAMRLHLETASRFAEIWDR